MIEIPDVIRRKEAIDAVKDAIIDAEQPYAEDALRRLPSVQDEIAKAVAEEIELADRREDDGK